MAGLIGDPTPQGGGILGGIGNGLDTFMSAMNPAYGQMLYQRQMMQTALGSLMSPQADGTPGMSFPQAMITLQNPKVQEQLFGVQQLGDYKTPGGYSGPVINRQGKVAPLYPTANGQAPADLSVREVKPFSSLVDLSGASTPPAPAGQPTGQPTGQQPAAQPAQPSRGNVLYQNNGNMNANTVDFVARQMLAGDDSGLKNNRTTEGAMFNQAVRNRMVELAGQNDVSPEEMAARNAEYKGYNSAQTTLGNRLGTVSLAINEAKQLIPQALSASNDVYRVLGGQYMPVNKIVNAYQENTGDPAIIKLGAALYGLAHTYARAVNPTGAIADADVERAYKILDAGLSKGQLSGGISQIYNEMQAAGKSPGAVKQEFREQFTGTAGLAGNKQPAQTQYFNTPAEAQQAIQSGRVKSGDVIQTPNGPIKVH